MTVIARTVDPKNFIKNHIYNMGFYTQTPYMQKQIKRSLAIISKFYTT